MFYHNGVKEGLTSGGCTNKLNIMVLVPRGKICMFGFPIMFLRNPSMTILQSLLINSNAIIQVILSKYEGYSIKTETKTGIPLINYLTGFKLFHVHCHHSNLNTSPRATATPRRPSGSHS